jgi:D-amino peptidase
VTAGRSGGRRVAAVRAMPVAAVLAAACGVGPATDPPAGVAYTLHDPEPVAAGGPRVLIYHDMEGLAGQDDPHTFRFAHPERYAIGRQLLTADVNAVAAGLFDGGAAEVHVVDAHGSGNPDPDLLVDVLDPRVVRVERDTPFRPYVDLVEAGAYDAVAVVGMHAKTGSGGFASHTFTLGMDILMNGLSITETELIAFAWGRAGVPVIFGSGDDRLAADLAPTMPWLEFVTVKTATSASTAVPRPVDEARAELRERARRALEGRDAARVMRLTEPVRAGLRAVPPASLDVLRGVPGVLFDGDAVVFTADDFQAAYDGVIALIGVARTAYASVMQEVIRAHRDGARINADYGDRLFDRWLDYESGRWAPPPPAAPRPGRRYHGAN